MKTCPDCKITKLTSEFHKDKSKKDGLCFYCKDCCKKWENENKLLTNGYARKTYHKHRTKRLAKVKEYAKSDTGIKKRIDWRLKDNYGISLDYYDKLYSEQNGGCAICFENQSTLNKRLCVDHCHITGRVRGLLCTNCNSGIGKLLHNIEIFNRAAVYVQER